MGELGGNLRKLKVFVARMNKQTPLALGPCAMRKDKSHAKVHTQRQLVAKPSARQASAQARVLRVKARSSAFKTSNSQAFKFTTSPTSTWPHGFQLHQQTGRLLRLA